MVTEPFRDLLIRDAVVRRPDLGFLVACDPKDEEDDVPHAILFTWKAGSFIRANANFNIHACCIIDNPEYGVVYVEEVGGYSVQTRTGLTIGDIVEDSRPPAKEPRGGGFRSVSAIAGKAYAVGYRGRAYRLDRLSQWTRIDEDLPRNFNIEAIHGFDECDVYAVGRQGEVWHFDGEQWSKREVPANAYFTRVKCAADSIVYIAGHNGFMMRGREEVWEIVNQEATTDDLWGLEWFEGSLYVATMSNVYRLEGDELELVDFGKETPNTCYKLSASEGVMWSAGEEDVLSFDGKTWTRIV